jgi:hypothetical protein
MGGWTSKSVGGEAVADNQTMSGLDLSSSHNSITGDVKTRLHASSLLEQTIE